MSVATDHRDRETQREFLFLTLCLGVSVPLWLVGSGGKANPSIRKFVNPSIQHHTVIPTVNVAVYPAVGLPVTFAISDATLSANTLSRALAVGF